jgi:Tfp pilus assembly protein PilF
MLAVLPLLPGCFFSARERAQQHRDAALRAMLADDFRTAKEEMDASKGAAEIIPEIDALDGYLAIRRGEYSEAETSYRRAVRRTPESLSAHNNLGLLLMRSGSAKAARPQFQEALDLDSSDPRLWNNYGVTLRALGLTREAEAAFQRAVSLDRGNGDARSNLGFMLFERGAFAAAADAWRAATFIDPQNADAWAGLAIALLRVKQRGRAVRAAAAAVYIDPTYRAPRALVHRYLWSAQARAALSEVLAALPPGPAQMHDMPVPARAFGTMQLIEDPLLDKFRRGRP